MFDPKHEKDRIKSSRYLDRESNRTWFFDIRIEGLCETYSGHRFIVEMQKTSISSHKNRWVYYGARELVSIGTKHYFLDNEQEDAKRKNIQMHYDRLAPVKSVTVLDSDSQTTGDELQNDEDVIGIFWNVNQQKLFQISYHGHMLFYQDLKRI